MIKWLMWILIEWSVILGSMAAVYTWWFLFPLVILVVGCRQQALVVLGHEAAHYTMGRSKLPELIANPLCFWLLGSDLYAYREAHIAHHRLVGHPNDPEVIVRSKTPDSWTGLTRRKKALLLLKDLLGLNIREAFTITEPAAGKYTWPRVLYIASVISAVLLAGLWPLLLLWLWTLPTATLAFSRVRSWKEHWDLPPGQTHSHTPTLLQRLAFPHYVWKHRDHHTPGRWHIPCWELER
jgi:fatty acid desaturase